MNMDTDFTGKIHDLDRAVREHTVSKVNGTILAAFCALVAAGCASQTGKILVDATGWSEQQLDDWYIQFQTADHGALERQDFSGISGRVIALILKAHGELERNHKDVCRQTDISDYLVLVKELDSEMIISFTPRLVPGEPPPLPPPPPGYVNYEYDPIPGAVVLTGCDIEFSIDKRTDEITVVRVI